MITMERRRVLQAFLPEASNPVSQVTIPFATTFIAVPIRGGHHGTLRK